MEAKEKNACLQLMLFFKDAAKPSKNKVDKKKLYILVNRYLQLFFRVCGSVCIYLCIV